MISRSLKKNLFKLYLHLPGNRIIFSAIKKIGVPPYRWRKFLRFKGSFDLELTNNVSIKLMSYGNTIENELFWIGAKGWEGRTLQIWRKLSEQSSVIFDVGANTGLFSLISAKVNPSAAVYAFEPLHVGMQRIIKNLSLNDLKVNACEIALADEDGQGKIFVADTISGTFDQATLNQGRHDHVSNNYVVITMKKLSTLIEERNVTGIDLMKIDVETYEPNVLRGMGPYLHKFAPSILIEILNEKVALEVERIVAGMSYDYYLIDEKEGYLPRTDLKPGKRGNNFLLLNKIRHPDIRIVS